ncbi:MAG: DGQHR domain-containing protein [Deltaproteobacteria bacterium]|nr:DGQHR domain-containing protein [Deltaproteobacteria bacterium]
MSNLIPALKILQNERPILIFSLPAIELLNISYFNPREIDREEGIQRPYQSKRSKAIAEYIDTDDSVLANNIIINFELEKNGLSLEKVYDEKNGKLDIQTLKTLSNKLKNKQKIAFVIDGQHRLRAFEHTSKKKFQLVVAALLDLSLAEVAELFVKINYFQKPVNKSLVLDLLGISEKIFPQYFKLHKVVEKLDADIASPFYGKIKMLGLGKGYISQASIISSIERYKLEKILEEAHIEPTEEVLYDITWNFFKAVEKIFSPFWGSNKLLSKTIGIRALFMVLGHVLSEAIKSKKEFSATNIQKELKKIDQAIFSNPDITSFGGEKGVKQLSGKMIEGLR